MKCPRCSSELESDAIFCPICGECVNKESAPIPKEEVSAPAKPRSSASHDSENSTSLNSNEPRATFNHTNITKKIIGLIVGTMLILIGFSRIGAAGTTISTTSFGTDFYTYTYRGIVAIAESLEVIQITLGWVIVSIGAAIDVHSLQR